MAQMIPDTLPRRATAGERAICSTLKPILPEECAVYYEPRVLGKNPDLIIINPEMGIVILEVKDWLPSTILQMGTHTWTIKDKDTGEPKEVTSPIKQAEGYAQSVYNLLKRDKRLQSINGRTGSLKVPYGYGVVFTRMSDLDFAKMNMYNMIPSNQLLCRSDVDMNHDDFVSADLLEKLMNMLNIRFTGKLTPEDMNTIRWHLFPEVRIDAGSVKYNEQNLLSMRTIKSMDLYQEVLSKQLGDKHRRVRGVAGSGKSLILVARAKLLAQEHPDWKILVLTCGIPFSRKLATMIHNDGELHNVMVTAFHEWSTQVLRCFNADYLASLLNSDVPMPRYDAILIDEGQDFELDWIKVILKCLNPETQCLLLVEDQVQNIYKRKGSLSQDAGLDFRGRSYVMRINYRNTKEIIEFAWRFYNNFSEKAIPANREDSEIIAPSSTKRTGDLPEVHRFKSLPAECVWIANKILELLSKGIAPQEIAILYRVKKALRMNYADEIQKALQKADIPYSWVVKDQHSKRSYNPQDPTIKLCTLDSAKGLDFQAVFIFGVESCPFPMDMDMEREVSLVYIGMTRSTAKLYLSFTGKSVFTDYLEKFRVNYSAVRRMNSFREE